MDQVKFDQTMQLCQMAARIMLTAGAETYRVEDTIVRMGRACGMEAEAFVTPTGIFVTLNYGDHVHTSMMRISYRSTNLTKVSEVNRVSRQLATGEIDQDQAKEELKAIAGQANVYPIWLYFLAAGLASASFGFLFSGSVLDAVLAGMIGILVTFADDYIAERHTMVVMSTFVGAVIAASAAFGATLIFPAAQVSNIIIGSIVPLLPGVAITNSIRDMIAGDLVSGLARGAEALLISVSVATGVVAVLAIFV